MGSNRVTAVRLRELLHYDPLTGIFTWRVDRRGTVKAGDEAGNLAWDGYVNIQVEGRRYPAHVLAWFYTHGRWPPDDIDHRDTVRDHNWIENLREATFAMNRQNLRKATAKNLHSGLLGAHWAPDHKLKPWRASITVEKKRKHLGYFETPEAAHVAYIAAKRQHHPGNTL